MKLLSTTIAAFMLQCTGAEDVHAWGQDGHRVVGAIALEIVLPEVRAELNRILDTTQYEEIIEWCNWPDAYRSTNEGAWTAPLHYVNVALGAGQYDAQRDCADELCVTEAIPKFAEELGNPDLPQIQRREAFGFVCHFVGDLSQPLHAGFGFDRGGNDFDIVFNQQPSNLHRFWDTLLLVNREDSWRDLSRQLLHGYRPIPRKTFDREVTIRWTNDSHRIADERAYPPTEEISEAFADRSWQLMQVQLMRGGQNLATVLNRTLGEIATD